MATKSTLRAINIGLTDSEREGVINLLNVALSDGYLLLIKTKKYHWDVVGPQFLTLHQLWEEQYQMLSESIDEYAERVRMLGGYPVGTAAGFLQYTTLTEDAGDILSATDMVARLVADHEQIIRNLRSAVDQCSDDFHDEGTTDFLTGKMEAHEAMAWMLRSFIEGEAVKPNGQIPSANAVAIPAGV
ncbi:Dps family protein [Alkalinema sp. FACHB-956]|uniref:Dps family protein n=1 Tax=Alkalinema sp. FACHB-956 TaxID=2692768 RepID=UPI0016862906|nr:Dps family protein [Alkalinema sp. FACHB-956]MBD2327994.1 DNA starvation/stationary phase protection protein [Alkalinema sp. FACHB-956]